MVPDLTVERISRLVVSDKRAQGQYERASGVHHPTPSFLFREYPSALEALAKILALAASECEGIEAGESVGGVGIGFKKMKRFGCVQVKFRVNCPSPER